MRQEVSANGFDYSPLECAGWALPSTVFLAHGENYAVAAGGIGERFRPFSVRVRWLGTAFDRSGMPLLCVLRRKGRNAFPARLHHTAFPFHNEGGR